MAVKARFDSGTIGTRFVELTDAGLPCPYPIPIRLNTYDQAFVEAKSNADAIGSDVLEVPIAVHGGIRETSEIDSFRFGVHQTGMVSLEVFASRLGSLLDSLVEVRDQEGRSVCSGDDFESHDSRLVFEAKAGETYTASIRDKRKNAGAAYSYCVEIAPLQSSLTAFLPRRSKLSQAGQTMVRPDLDFEYPRRTVSGTIDTLVDDRLKFMHLAPSELADDEQFLRRVSIDLIGLLPSPEEYQEFTQDTSANKRERLVDRLLERPEVLDIWVMKWAELLQIRTNNGVSQKALRLYDRWLRDAVHAGTTIDKIVQMVLPASGCVARLHQSSDRDDRQTSWIAQGVASRSGRRWFGRSLFQRLRLGLRSIDQVVVIDRPAIGSALQLGGLRR